MSSVAYSCELLRGMNKQGILTPNVDGYYPVCVGAVNIHNFHGDYYPFTQSVKGMFEAGSEFQRRVKTHQLRGECEHPKPWPGMTQQQWFARLRRIALDRVSHHFKSIVLDFSLLEKNGSGSIIPILAELRPSGVFEKGLKSSLDNPGEDTSFSIRSITIDTPIGVRDRKEIEYIATFDWVPEGGIGIATKYHSPGLESLDSGELSLQGIQEDIALIKQTSGFGLESGENVTELENLVTSLIASGVKTEVIAPRSLRW